VLASTFAFLPRVAGEIVSSVAVGPNSNGSTDSVLEGTGRFCGVVFVRDLAGGFGFFGVLTSVRGDDGGLLENTSSLACKARAV